MFAAKIPQAEAALDWRRAIAPPQPGAASPSAACVAPPLPSAIGNQATLRLLTGRDDAAFTRPVDAAEREADRMADAVVAGRPSGGAFAPRPTLARSPARDAPGLGRGGVDAAGSLGRALDPSVRGWFEPRFGRDLSGVRVHDDARAAALARQLGAGAFAHGADLYFGQSEFAPATERGRHLLAHEIAHTLQPHDPAIVARKTLTDIAPAARQKLVFSRVPLDQATVDGWIATYFAAKPGSGFTSMVNAEFGAEVTDAVQKKALQSVATELSNLSQAHVTPATATTPEERTNTDPEGWPLPPNSIYELALDARPQGGEHAIFRFTRYGSGSADTVLIEKTKVLAPAPVKSTPPATGSTSGPTSAPRSAPTSAPTTTPSTGGATLHFTGAVHVGAVNLTIDSAFGDDRGKLIEDTVQLLPDPIRAKVDGVTFEYQTSGKGPAGESGDYQSDRDVVRLWGAAFDATPKRVGEATNASYVIIHELGHLIDMRPEFKAQRDRDAAQARKQKLQTDMLHAGDKFIDPNDPLGGLDIDKDPRVVAEKARIQSLIDQAVRDINAANTAMASAKSLSGHEVGTNTESMLTDFARALAADGVTAVTNAKQRNRATDAANAAAKRANEADPTGPQRAMRPHEKLLGGGVSGYAATDLTEAFAENFAYYVLDGAAYQAIRPQTYAFFARVFPKTTPATP